MPGKLYQVNKSFGQISKLKINYSMHIVMNKVVSKKKLQKLDSYSITLLW